MSDNHSGGSGTVSQSEYAGGSIFPVFGCGPRFAIRLGLRQSGQNPQMGYPLAWTTRYMLWSDLELPPTSRRYGTGSTCTAF